MLRLLAVTNLYPTPQTPSSGTFIEQQVKGLRQSGVDAEVMLVDRRQKGMRAYWGLGGQVSARIADVRPDVVHVMYGGIMADEVTRGVKNKPLVVSFCGEDLLGEPLAGYREVGRPVIGYLRKMVSEYGVWASHRAARRAHRIIVKSKNLQDALPQDVDRSKVQIIPNGIDLERFKPVAQGEARRTLGWSADRAVVLFVTVGGDPRKRLGLAQDAVAKIKCERAVDFRIMSGVPHEQVPLWLNASDILLLTSFHEGGVNIVKEAMACNLPVVSVDVGDVRERLTPVRSCVITEPTPDALGSALSDVLHRGGRSDGRNHLNALTLSAVAAQLKQVYNLALSDCRTTPAYSLRAEKA